MVKAKIAVCLIKHHAMKTYEGVEILIHYFFIFGTRWALAHSLPNRLIFGERASSIRWIGGRIGLRAVRCCRSGSS
jgi:hypothetical protein